MLVRAVDWTPLAAATAIAVALAALLNVQDPHLDPGFAVLALRMAGVMLGTAAGFTLVDAMAASTAAVPVPRWVRQWLRTGLGAAAAATGWGAAAAVTALRLPPGGSFPFGGLALEAAAWVLAGLAGAAVAVRTVPGRPAALAGTGAQAVLGAVAVLQAGGAANAWPLPADPSWTAAQRGWAWALLPAFLALLAAHRAPRTRPGALIGRPPAPRSGAPSRLDGEVPARR
ncbi:hypothetical protein Sru01_22860 [Sphaerisporangium rufum]|uniref:Uncharacterized protein n=1 Tax=Sphaerisporangium rufum TaxID=1381558 RepID=A0A919R015_9ACTN|nr:hypothetical protein Sru01_22860 [Sphaerisporangium rufum]